MKGAGELDLISILNLTTNLSLQQKTLKLTINGELELGPSTKLVSGHCVEGEEAGWYVGKTKGFNLRSRYLPKYWTLIVSIRKK